MTPATDALPGLDQLRDLPLPPPPPYWPQTWGWIVLAAILAALTIYTAWAYRRNRRRNLYRREALRELDKIALATDDNPLAARNLPALLKRTALSAESRNGKNGVAPMSGHGWTEFLVRSARPATFPPDVAALLSTLAYAPDGTVLELDSVRVKQVFAASRQWIERHHVAP